jgi:chorismate dehydratase
MRKFVKSLQHNPDLIPVGRIQYINVDPIYYSFTQHASPMPVEVISRPPAVLNQLMASGELYISAVSSSAYALNFTDWLMLPDLSISCYGKVMSVLLASRRPIQQLDGRSILLSDESSTAVDLLKLIFAQEKIRPVFKKGKVKSPADLSGDADGCLVIGDSALKHHWRHRFEYVFDLCEIWNEMTGLPFVFGIWAVRRNFSNRFPEKTAHILDAFYRSKSEGLANISDLAESASAKLDIPVNVCREYFNCMTYNFGESEYKALSSFFEGLYNYGIIHQLPLLEFYQPSSLSDHVMAVSQ